MWSFVIFCFEHFYILSNYIFCNFGFTSIYSSKIEFLSLFTDPDIMSNLNAVIFQATTFFLKYLHVGSFYTAIVHSDQVSSSKKDKKITIKVVLLCVLCSKSFEAFSLFFIYLFIFVLFGAWQQRWKLQVK